MGTAKGADHPVARGGSRSGDLDLLRVYFGGLDSHPLLTRDDEVRLAQRIEAGRHAEEQLTRTGRMSPARRRALGEIARAGREARSEFVAANLRLVVSIAKHWQHRGVALSDLIQEGNLGLLKAVDRFDWRQGNKFSTYATWWITTAVIQAVGEGSSVHLPRQRRHQARVLAETADRIEHETGRRPGPDELAGATGISIEDIAALRRASNRVASLSAPIDDDGGQLGDVLADPSVDVAQTAADDQLPEEVERLLASLPAAAARVLRLRFGMDRGIPRTAAEVGAMLSISPERVSQIERRALTRLRHQLRPLHVAS